MHTDIHHDGSPLYVSNAQPRLGERVTLRLRSSAGCQPGVVAVRVLHDGEPKLYVAESSAGENGETWWTADVEVRNPVTSVRFSCRIPSLTR